MTADQYESSSCCLVRGIIMHSILLSLKQCSYVEKRIDPVNIFVKLNSYIVDLTDAVWSTAGLQPVEGAFLVDF
jgi:hypothetical protein